MPHIDYKSSIDKLPFFSDESVDLIYCSHALEYFDRDQVRGVLKEWHRVLKPRGVLRVAVPDFETLIRVYQQTGDISKVLGPLYGKMVIKTPTEVTALYHKTAYDENSLSRLLLENGFEDSHRWNWRTTEHSEIDDHSQAYFPHMQKETGILVSLNMQASKRT
jgi:predicted SAM-dependent methyltransferase